MNGHFITFEGIEGSGKTTQAEKAEEYLKQLGCPVLRTREPGGTPTGIEIRSILLDKNDLSFPLHPITELLLYSADRIQHLHEVIIPALKKKITVICDRYIDSTTAYQGGGRGLNFELIQQVHKIATFGIYPTRTYLLDLPVEVGLSRINKRGNSLDRLETESIEFHQKVRDCFLRIAKENPHRIMVIDATQPEDAISAIIQKDLKEICSRH